MKTIHNNTTVNAKYNSQRYHKAHQLHTKPHQAPHTTVSASHNEPSNTDILGVCQIFLLPPSPLIHKV